MIQERDLRAKRGGLTAQAPAVYVPIYDFNGNVINYVEINRGEGITHTFDYDAFGRELTQDTLIPSGNTSPPESLPIKFSTKYHDEETGLAYYGYRYYSAEMGRWVNRDPIGEQGGINLYGMVGNDVVNNWDYLGLEKQVEIDLLMHWHYKTGHVLETWTIMTKKVVVTWECTKKGEVSSPIRAKWKDGSAAVQEISIGFWIFGASATEALRIELLRQDHASSGLLFKVWYEESKKIGINAVKGLSSIEVHNDSDTIIRGSKEVILNCSCVLK